MANKYLKHTWQKVLLGIFLFVIIIIILPAIILNKYWSPILADKVKSAVLKGTDSLYKVDFSTAELHLLQGKIVVYEAKLIPDTAVYNRKKKEGQAPGSLYEVQVKRIVLTHIHPFKLYFGHKLDIGRIALTAPQLQVSHYSDKSKDSTKKDNRTLYQKISKSLGLIHVGEIYVSDVNLKYKNYTGDKPVVSELKEMNLKATDLLIDSATQTDTSRFLYCKDVTTQLYNYTGKTANGLYTYTFKSAKLSTQSSQLNIEGLDLQPVKPAAFFEKSDGDRFTLHLDSVQLSNFDFITYNRSKEFNASNITLGGGSFNVYSKPSGVPKKTDRLATFPHVGIKKIKSAFNIDTLTLKHVDVVYNEYNKKSKKVGDVVFNNTDATFLNITNNKDTLSKNNICTASITSYFMGKGKLDLNFAFNLTDEANSYSYKGHLAPMDMQYINKATMPLALIKITSGKIKSFDFDIHATKKTSKGKIKLLYNDLKISMLKADENGYSKKALATLFANTFVLKHNNPDDPGETPRSANVVFNRPYNFPFFKTLWQTLLKGIKPCAGVGEEKEKQAMKQMDEHEKKKQERAIKKAKKKAEEARKKSKG
ncbi:hypothetical protein [Mucilaginibacter segetis]|uniref:DUF748 domain-containing protein n=1 Tax=Mucilaginibacter segetis TaxID=2793071 RepID=A0A934PS44_9SPHI|nr:hypothetical protein [Mucilaginibacter segetis]MBK0377953.1 hypothetical protein [Mucilaginibacter segetis]